MKQSLLLLAILFALSSCIKNDNPGGNPPTDEKWIPFAFSTIGKTHIDLSYNDLGGISAPVYFEIYDQMPVAQTPDGSAYVRIWGVEPVYAGVTQLNGNFNGTIELPAYMKTAYIYSLSFYAQTLIVAEITNNSLTAKDEESGPEPAISATRAKEFNSDAVENGGWKTYLGDYETTYGRIQYKYSGNDLICKNDKDLYAAHSAVINTSKPCPEEYRASKDMYIKENAEAAITFLGSNTCWNCSLGYYFYKNGEKPKSLAQANVIMLFPNTQDGQWSNDKNQSNRYRGVNRGTAVQLMYYPDINNPKSGTTVFPAGYRIGFVLACNAWQNRLSNFNVSKSYCAATSDGLSIDDQGNAFPGPRTAVYRYTNTSKDVDAVMISFEDYTTDENFSDVVIALVSNPAKAIEDIPSVDQEGTLQKIKMLKGIYSFEDLWPSRGDYDMNDVMVKAEYEKKYNDSGIHEESFVYTYLPNASTGLRNGLAVAFDQAPAMVSCFVKAPQQTEYTPIEIAREGNVLPLTNDVKEHGGYSYKITVTYASPQQTGATVKPFIYRYDNGAGAPRWELHLPFEAPTAQADMKLFGTSDDRSEPVKGIYYVRQAQYPFAFFLSGANESDLSDMLKPQNEKVTIDKLYPNYSKWVESHGQSHNDWYKK